MASAGIQQRIERSPNGRAVITGFLLFTLAALFVTNVPDSAVHDAEQGMFRPYLHGTGLRQRWGMFAPNPTSRTVFVSAVITYADGSRETWTFPRSEKLVGAYRGYRWRQIAQDAQLRENRFVLWPKFAAWVAREQADQERRPVAVTLVRTVRYTSPPGESEKQPWEQEAYFVLDVASGRGRFL